MQSMPAPSPFASGNPPAAPVEGFLGRGPLGEVPSAPLMTVHQLSSQDQFVVSSCFALLQEVVQGGVDGWVHVWARGRAERNA